MELAGHAGRARPRWSFSLAGGIAHIACVTFLVAATPGCSFIFTRGPEAAPHPQPYPEPSRPPSPECTSSVAAPVVDTVLAAASVALIVAGIAAMSSKSSCHPGDFFCDPNNAFEHGTGEIGIFVGALTGVVFTASAVAGYQRTGACRATLNSTAFLSRSRASLPLLSPLEGCSPVGDAPRLCSSSVASWPSREESGPGTSLAGAR